jgi:hypothetical protein
MPGTCGTGGTRESRLFGGSGRNHQAKPTEPAIKVDIAWGTSMPTRTTKTNVRYQTPRSPGDCGPRPTCAG